MNKIRAIVACEESQAVLEELLKLGVDAYSCDLLPTSGKYPERHFQEDIFKVLAREDKFDLMIGHPPCTFLTVTGNAWFNVEKYGDKAIQRIKDREDALIFFIQLMEADIEHISLENPIGFVSTAYRKPNQIISPWMFGDKTEKKTCLWTKNLPNLIPEITEKPELEYFEWISKKGVKKRQSLWYYQTRCLPHSQRATAASKTFPGIAKALATQYVSHILNQRNGTHR